MAIHEEDKKRFQFLLYLSTLTPEELKNKRHGDRLNFFDDLRNFFDFPKAENDGDDGLETEIERAIRKAEANLSRLKDTMARAKVILDTVTKGHVHSFTFSGDFKMWIDPGVPKGDSRSMVGWDSPSIEDVLTLAASELLDDPSIQGRVVRCTRKQCDSVFLKNRTQQTFCSRACAQIAASSRYREKHRAILQDQAHRRHEQKQKGKYGSNVKVHRHPRAVQLKRHS